jgi:hypothetical protein
MQGYSKERGICLFFTVELSLGAWARVLHQAKNGSCNVLAESSADAIRVFSGETKRETMVKNNRARQTNRYGWRAGAVTLAAVAMLLPACAEVEEETAEVAPETDQSPVAEEIAEEPSEYYGQTVTIRGEVEEAIDEISFTITADEFLFEGEEILIVNTTGTAFALPEEGTPVQVTGEVRQFKAFDFDEEFDLTPQIEAEDYEERPTIAAESLVPAPEPDEITEEPELYYGETIATQGEVDENLGPNTFTLEGGDLLVLNLAEPERALEDDEVVVVTGELRQFVIADFERDYDLTWDADLQTQLEAEYQDRPVLVANHIYPVDEQQ